METKLIILRGNSGSGKTTIAKLLQAELGAAALVVSQDVVRREMLAVKDGPENLAIELLKQISQYGNHRLSYVIIEGILRRDWYEVMLKDLIGEFAQSYFYYFDLSFEETLKRHQTKVKAVEFGEKELKSWWLENDVLEIEGEQMIDFSLTEQEVLAKILANVLSDQKDDDEMELRTERCLIRPFEERDIESLMTYRNNREWMQYQDFKGLTAEAYKAALFPTRHPSQGQQLAVVSCLTNQLIGDVYLKTEEKIMWLGYTISPSYARQGYGFEVVSELIQWAKAAGFTLMAAVLAENLASIRLLTKLGFSYVETLAGEMIYQLSI